jgi:hypothetical protein
MNKSQSRVPWSRRSSYITLWLQPHEDGGVASLCLSISCLLIIDSCSTPNNCSEFRFPGIRHKHWSHNPKMAAKNIIASDFAINKKHCFLLSSGENFQVFRLLSEPASYCFGCFPNPYSKRSLIVIACYLKKVDSRIKRMLSIIRITSRLFLYMHCGQPLTVIWGGGM